MRILISSEYDYEVLVEDDITATLIHQELEDRILEIEVSISDIDEWLVSDDTTLQVSESFGEVICLRKDNEDDYPLVFGDYDVLCSLDDTLCGVIDNSPEVETIDLDFINPYEDKVDKFERLRRWVESHPLLWQRFSYQKIADELKLSQGFVRFHLCDCVISAKYCETEAEFNQKRADSPTEKRVKTQPSPTIAKISEWLNANPHRWQYVTYKEIGEESETSFDAVSKNLPKVAFAEGFVSDLLAYQKTRDESKRKRKADKSEAPRYIIEIL
ncbi:MAG: hypothetical protein OXH65_06345 [Paracoccaceae bacterium]|nr:hypothetical protein [Paracoccaceae bacterium]